MALRQENLAVSGRKVKKPGAMGTPRIFILVKTALINEKG